MPAPDAVVEAAIQNQPIKVTSDEGRVTTHAQYIAGKLRQEQRAKIIEKAMERKAKARQEVTAAEDATPAVVTARAKKDAARQKRNEAIAARENAPKNEKKNYNQQIKRANAEVRQARREEKRARRSKEIKNAKGDTRLQRGWANLRFVVSMGRVVGGEMKEPLAKLVRAERVRVALHQSEAGGAITLATRFLPGKLTDIQVQSATEHHHELERLAGREGKTVGEAQFGEHVIDTIVAGSPVHKAIIESLTSYGIAKEIQRIAGLPDSADRNAARRAVGEELRGVLEFIALKYPDDPLAQEFLGTNATQAERQATAEGIIEMCLSFGVDNLARMQQEAITLEKAHKGSGYFEQQYDVYRSWGELVLKNVRTGLTIGATLHLLTNPLTALPTVGVLSAGGMTFFAQRIKMQYDRGIALMDQTRDIYQSPQEKEGALKVWESIWGKDINPVASQEESNSQINKLALRRGALVAAMSFVFGAGGHEVIGDVLRHHAAAQETASHVAEHTLVRGRGGAFVLGNEPPHDPNTIGRAQDLPPGPQTPAAPATGGGGFNPTGTEAQQAAAWQHRADVDFRLGNTVLSGLEYAQSITHGIHADLDSAALTAQGIINHEIHSGDNFDNFGNTKVDLGSAHFVTHVQNGDIIQARDGQYYLLGYLAHQKPGESNIALYHVTSYNPQSHGFSFDASSEKPLTLGRVDTVDADYVRKSLMTTQHGIDFHGGSPISVENTPSSQYFQFGNVHGVETIHFTKAFMDQVHAANSAHAPAIIISDGKGHYIVVGVDKPMASLIQPDTNGDGGGTLALDPSGASYHDNVIQIFGTDGRYPATPQMLSQLMLGREVHAGTIDFQNTAIHGGLRIQDLHIISRADTTFSGSVAPAEFQQNIVDLSGPGGIGAGGGNIFQQILFLIEQDPAKSITYAAAALLGNRLRALAYGNRFPNGVGPHSKGANTTLAATTLVELTVGLVMANPGVAAIAAYELGGYLVTAGWQRVFPGKSSGEGNEKKPDKNGKGGDAKKPDGPPIYPPAPPNEGSPPAGVSPAPGSSAGGPPTYPPPPSGNGGATPNPGAGVAAAGIAAAQTSPQAEITLTQEQEALAARLREARNQNEFIAFLGEVRPDLAQHQDLVDNFVLLWNTPGISREALTKAIVAYQLEPDTGSTAPAVPAMSSQKPAGSSTAVREVLAGAAGAAIAGLVVEAIDRRNAVRAAHSQAQAQGTSVPTALQEELAAANRHAREQTILNAALPQEIWDNSNFRNAVLQFYTTLGTYFADHGDDTTKINMKKLREELNRARNAGNPQEIEKAEDAYYGRIHDTYIAQFHDNRRPESEVPEVIKDAEDRYIAAIGQSAIAARTAASAATLAPASTASPDSSPRTPTDVASPGDH